MIECTDKSLLFSIWLFWQWITLLKRHNDKQTKHEGKKLKDLFIVYLFLEMSEKNDVSIVRFCINMKLAC